MNVRPMEEISAADIHAGQLWYWDTAYPIDRGTHRIRELDGDRVKLDRVSGRGRHRHVTTIGSLLAMWVLVGE